MRESDLIFTENGMSAFLFENNPEGIGFFNNYRYYHAVTPRDKTTLSFIHKCVWNKEMSKRAILGLNNEFIEGYNYSLPFDISTETYSKDKGQFEFINDTNKCDSNVP